ncbi:hypothetical protein Ndes2526A_g07871 [Nannochloris sp. 'desiccata']
MRTLQHACTARISASTAGNNKIHSKRLHTFLQRLKTTSTTSPTDTLRTFAYQSDATPTTSSIDRPDASFLSQDELNTLSATQLAFLVRKRKHALGLGPLFSADSQCSCCAGTGMVTCHQCNGTGLNGETKQEEMFDSTTEIRITNGHVNVSYYFVPNGPCWLCTSSKVIACSECAGSGIKGLAGFQGD